MLRCIRCGACMNHCPVYSAIGGHAYGWVYPGPDGRGADAGADRHRQGRAPAQRLDLLRALRGGLPDEDPAAQPDAALARGEFRAGDSSLAYRLGLKAWAAAAKRPRLYHALVKILMPVLGTLGRRRGAVPLAAARGRLDAASRPSPRRRGARSRRCGPTPRRGAAMSAPQDRRDAVIFKIRKALGAYDSAQRRAAVAQRLGASACAAGARARQRATGRGCGRLCCAPFSKASRRP